jgi:AraC-like DNA-binding protein
MFEKSQDFGLRVIYENPIQTIYHMERANTTSRMIAYRIYPGIELLLTDFQDKYTWAGQWEEKKEVYQISYCHNGVYQAELSKNKFSYASPGNVLLLNSCKKSLGSQMTTDTLQGFHIMVYPDLIENTTINDWKQQFDLDFRWLIKHMREIDRVKVYPCGAGMLHVAEELYELLYNHELGIVRLKLLEFFHLIRKEDFKIENAHRVFSKDQIEKTKTIRTMIEMDLSKHYTIKELCFNCDISTTILKECFKEIYQYPPYEYLRNARMNKAAEYLKNTSRSILDIGRLLGYENPSNFSRTFKEVYGMLPKEYRNKNV